ncbi:MAG: hypothetical protein HKO66_08515 [Saprospiraceae bacterium]|nr:hypothetical protein [Bacteroidia bacterium]NNL92259.1 hypothetical protein [Saprospiraceae bacterium]
MAYSVKRFLSYFKDVSLEQTSSNYNPHLEVLLVDGRHQLITKDAIYSFDDKYDNFYRSLKKINWELLTGKKVLVLGLGLGSVIYILEKKLNRIFEYTAVEIDEEIVRLAQKYTLNHLQSYVEVMVVDAAQYLRINNETYDLILMDIFQSAVIPEKFQDDVFLSTLKSKLNDNGLLLYNRMYANKSDLNENELFESQFSEIFPNNTVLSIKDNLVYFSDKKYLQ